MATPAASLGAASEEASPTWPEASASPASPASPEASESSEESEVAPRASLRVGMDVYAGRSNLTGHRRYNDGFWAGYGLGYPSVLNVNWEHARGDAALLSIGLGDYRGQSITQHQPVEAWWRTPVGKSNVTIGKFWVPFALYEWEGETKWGVLLEHEIGKYSLAASVNYNNNIHTTNAYMRIGRSFGENVNVGLSLGAGKGLSFDTVHDRGLGLDATVAWRGWQLSSELVRLQRRSSERFQFGYARLSYEKLGRWKPFISRHTWHDRAEELGSFHSTTYGLDFQLTKEITLQGAYASTASEGVHKNVKWIQVRWTPEWMLWQKAEKAPRAEQSTPAAPSTPTSPSTPAATP